MASYSLQPLRIVTGLPRTLQGIAVQ